MKIKKAIITAAGRNQQVLPLQTLVDRDGEQRSALRIIINESLSAGIDEICVIIAPGKRDAYLLAAGELADRLQFVEQPESRGYGHALYHGRAFAGDEPFLHLVSDHVYVSTGGATCASQLMKIAEAESCSVSAVQPTRESMLPFYGAVGGRRLANQSRVYEVERVLEKPTPTEAEEQLIVPGLRAGHYLCLFGMHVLTATVMEVLERQIGSLQPGQMLPLSPALSELPSRERYLAVELEGRRYNMGVKYGMLMTQLALDGNEREDVLAQTVEMLALRAR